MKIEKVQFLSCKANVHLISKVCEISVKASQYPRSDEHRQTTPLNIISTRWCFAESYADFLFSKCPTQIYLIVIVTYHFERRRNPSAIWRKVNANFWEVWQTEGQPKTVSSRYYGITVLTN